MKPEKIPFPRGPKAALAAACLALLASGASFVWYMGVRADRELRVDMIRQVRMVAQMVEIGRVQTLTGTESDLKNPNYQALKEQLSAVRSANPQCRFLYLMGRKADPLAAAAAQPGGMVCFLVDSEPVGSKDYSPPGEELPEATQEFRSMFDTKLELVEGPVTDRWGTWVSALVPLTNPQTGAVIAVLGMDIEGRSWKGDVAARVALPAGLMLVLLIGMASFFAAARPVCRDGTSRRAGAAPKPALRRLLPPVAAMVILLMLGAGALLYRQQLQLLASGSAADISDVAGDLRETLNQQTVSLADLAQPIASDATLQEALRECDAGRLLTVWRPVFERLHREKRLTHLYFYDTNRVCLLRVHQPENKGGRIERFTALEAERTGKTASGLELGPMGTFTLRAVQPVFKGGARVGYVELGQAIEEVLQTLRLRNGCQLAVSIRKEYLKRQTWEEGRRLLGREADWDRLPHSAVIYTAQGRLSAAFALMDERVAVGNPVSGETDREITFDGKDCRAFSTPLQDASGQEVGDLLILRDISKEKAAFARLLALGGTVGAVLLALFLGFIYVLLRRTDAGISAQQEELRESEQKFSLAFQTSPSAIIITRLEDGKFVEVNDAFTSMTGVARAEALANTSVGLELWVNEEERQRAMAVLRAGGSVVDQECLFRSTCGKAFTGLFSAHTIQLGTELCVLSCINDITAHKRAEEELQKIQKLQSVGTLAGGIAHDFNNILMGLYGNISLAKDDLAKDHPGYESLEEAEKSLRRAVRLTQQLLTFAKGGAPVKEDVSLGTLVEDVARFDLSGSNVRLVYQQAEDLWMAEVDKGQIQQVISNLTINARQAMSEGGHLYITLENAEIQKADEESRPGLRQGKYVKVTVRDEGVGIEPKNLDRIFDPYFTTKQTGSGLGLATTYSVINKHGGHIGVASELGKGTTFTLYLPASESQQHAVTRQPAAAGLPSARHARILVMDDEELVCGIVVKMLTRCGYSVATAPGGHEAVEMYKQALEAGAPFDVVIMDLTVPGGIGGKEAIKGLLAIDPRARAVVSSGYADDPVMANYAEYGFKGFAAKPYTQSKLREVLEQVLKPEG